MIAALPPLFASLESILVFVAIVLISALSNWLKQRQERKQAEARGETVPDGASPAPRPLFGDGEDEDVPPARPVTKPLDWQEELRRMLEGDTPRPTPPVTPPPLPRQTPMPVFDEEIPTRPAPVLTAPARTVVVSSQETPAARPLPMGRLQESATAFLRGTQVMGMAEARPQSVIGQVAAARPAAPMVVVGRSNEAALRLRSLLRDPVTVRQAVVASVVLGPPRALESA